MLLNQITFRKIQLLNKKSATKMQYNHFSTMERARGTTYYQEETVALL